MENEIMTPEEFKETMKSIVNDGHYEINVGCSLLGVKGFDCERTHRKMDDLMCELLRHLGYGDGIDIFEAAERWYA